LAEIFQLSRYLSGVPAAAADPRAFCRIKARPPQSNSQAFTGKQEALRRPRARKPIFFDSDGRRLRAAHRARASIVASTQERRKWKWKTIREHRSMKSMASSCGDGAGRVRSCDASLREYCRL